MKYHVVWKPTALTMLADIWVNATDPAAVTAASHQIEKLLQDNPIGQGESRVGEDRLMFEGPLSVYYRVDPIAQKVSVLLVRQTGRANS